MTKEQANQIQPDKENTLKICILIVDDSVEQREQIKAKILSNGSILPTDTLSLVDHYFNLKVFSSVGEAIEFLESQKDWKPDIASIDWNYESLPSNIYSSDERDKDRGLFLWQYLSKNHPKTILNIHTKYLNRSVLDSIPASNISAIHFSTDDVRSFMKEALLSVAKKYFQKNQRDSKKVTPLKDLLITVNETSKLLKATIMVGTDTIFCLKYLLVGYTESGFDEDDKPVLIFPELEALKNIIIDLLASDELGDFAGQLSNARVQEVLKAYSCHPNHQNWLKEIQKDTMDVVEEASKCFNQDRVLKPILRNPILINLNHNLNQLQKGTTALDNATMDILLKLLKCRLVIITIGHLKKLDSRKFFPQIADNRMIDFAILSIIKNSFEEFTEHSNYQNNHKQGKDHTDNIRKIFQTDLGFRGSLKNSKIEESCLLFEEKEFLRNNCAINL